MTPTKAPEDALVERLRGLALRNFSPDTCAGLTEAADAITTLLERIEKLEGQVRTMSEVAAHSARAALTREGN